MHYCDHKSDVLCTYTADILHEIVKAGFEKPTPIQVYRPMARTIVICVDAIMYL